MKSARRDWSAVSGDLRRSVRNPHLEPYGVEVSGLGMCCAGLRLAVATRGRAISLASMGFAAGQALLPIIFVALLTTYDWRNLWLLAAVCVVVTIPVIQVLLRQERTPQSMSGDAQTLGMGGKHWTRNELLRHPLFYLLVPLILGPAAWGTALFFQQVHLTEVKGWSLASFVALMPVYTVSTIAFTFITGWAVDRFGVKWVVPFQMVPFAVSFLVLAFADTIFAAGLGLVIFGIGQGMQGTATTAFWAVFYGTRNLGSIKAAAAALMVFGSAIGPGITGALIDLGIDFPDQGLDLLVVVIAIGETGRDAELAVRHRRADHDRTRGGVAAVDAPLRASQHIDSIEVEELAELNRR